MSGWSWAVVALVAVVLVAVLTIEDGRRRRSRLRQRFGPEYDRVVTGAGGRRAGEAALQRRARRRSQLTVVPLPEEARRAYVQRWRAVQEEFVDRPGEAVATAELLLHRVMAERGYPVQDFERQAELVSVDHPDVVEDYRVAHAIQQRQAAGRASTDDLREALLRYRSLFDGLLQPPLPRADDAAPRRAGASAARGTNEDREEQR